MDCSLPDFSVYGILHVGILEWGAIAFSKVMLKILQARFQQWTKNFQMYKLGLEKAEEPEIKLPTSVES